MQNSDYDLLVAVAEPQARRVVAARYDLQSGAIPVLAAVIFRSNTGWGARPRDIYNAGLASETLIRHYLATLIDKKLVERHIASRTKFLRPTNGGMLVMEEYKRQLRAGRQAFERP